MLLLKVWDLMLLVILMLGIWVCCYKIIIILKRYSDRVSIEIEISAILWKDINRGTTHTNHDLLIGKTDNDQITNRQPLLILWKILARGQE